MNNIVYVMALFLLAGLAEIGGGWLVWQWLRNGFGWPWGLLGALILVLYGVIPTLQPEASFGRVYAAYGGIFIILSLLWGRMVDGWRPDRFGHDWRVDRADWRCGDFVGTALVLTLLHLPHHIDTILSTLA